MQTVGPIPDCLVSLLTGQPPGEPYYMAVGGVRRLVIPAAFIIETFESALGSFEHSVPASTSMTLD